VLVSQVIQLTQLRLHYVLAETTQSPATLTPAPVQLPLCEYPAKVEDTLVTNPLLAVAALTDATVVASGLPRLASKNSHIEIVLAATVTVTELWQT
jgi:hypothetical protein